jgi:hypothetical protein
MGHKKMFHVEHFFLAETCGRNETQERKGRLHWWVLTLTHSGVIPRVGVLQPTEGSGAQCGKKRPCPLVCEIFCAQEIVPRGTISWTPRTEHVYHYMNMTACKSFVV